MTSMDRRTFLQLLGSTALAGTLPASIARALTIPANHRTGSIDDVEHIVILMQENRSFDHYFGSLRGVRGYGDARPVRLSTGNTVWYQPDGGDKDDYVLPFRPDADKLGLQFLEDLPHDWSSTQAAWNEGRFDQWVPNKGLASMAYLTRADIPFHYALADAFTVCDAYHCSLLGPTDPNRYYMWTGWTGNDGKGGGPVLGDEEAGYAWSTYPEVLEKAGVSWKIYQDIGVGLDAAGYWGWTSDAYIGNYGDNSLLYFDQYRNAQPGSPLYDKARTGTNTLAGGTLFDELRADVLAGRLPQVSWIVVPEAYSEHPNWPANYGAWYVSQMLDALTADPKVWGKTALLITYDENDGFFDHQVPPTPALSREQGLSTVDVVNEAFPGNAGYSSGPYGMGPRVPMLVVSPWSRGGWVCSEVFDHTSIIRFIEKRFGRDYPGLDEHQITPWRRAVSGDLSSAFDFSKSDQRRISLPDTAAYAPPDQLRHPDFVAVPPLDQALPVQEPGLRPARALPYELHVNGHANGENQFRIEFANTGGAGACFQVRSATSADAPRSYTVEAGKTLADTWPLQGKYDLAVHGPNGFLRRFTGDSAQAVHLHAATCYDARRGGIELVLSNESHSACAVSVENAYGRETIAYLLRPGERIEKYWRLEGSFGWYDLRVRSAGKLLQRLAGHVETGSASVSDPAIANPRWLQHDDA